jgi:hypothetical protein
MPKEKIAKYVRYAIRGLPLAAIAISNLVVTSAQAHQFLILITLLWFQVFLFFDLFSPGK